MKNKKIFTVVFLLAAALLFTSCAFKMNTAQKEHYEKFHTQYVNELFTEMTKVNHE